jgi:hypothetical protein
MVSFQVSISGQTFNLDMFKDNDFKLNLSFAEIQDITKRNSTYSTSFYVPGSKANNDIFQHFYDLNTTYTDYDLTKKMDAILTYNGYEILEGYLRLNFVNIENREVIYNLTFYSEFGNLLANISDKLMYDLDLSDLDHPYDAEAQALASLYDPSIYIPTGTTQPYQDGRTYWFFGNFGYSYSGNAINTFITPKLEFRQGGNFLQQIGYFDNQLTPLRSFYTKSAVSFKVLYETIFNKAGYNIQSEFFNTDYFKRYYLPQTFSTDGLNLNQGVPLEYQTIQTGDPINNIGITWYDLSTTGGTPMQRARLTPATKDNISASTFNNYYFQLNTDGFYQARYTISAYNSERVPDTIDLTAGVDFYLHKITSGTTTGTTLWTGLDSLQAGQEGTLSFNITFLGEVGGRYALDYRLFGLGSYEITLLDFEITLAPPIVVGDFKYNLEFPNDKFKQVEFIQAVNNLFNLVVIPSTEYSNTLIVEPMIDYIGKGQVLDWSDKIDRSQPIQISPTTTLINGSLYYNIQRDTDNGNEQFFSNTNEIFGTEFIDLNTDYKENKTDFNSVFGSSVDYVLTNQQNQYATLPIFYVLETTENEGQVLQKFIPFKSLPRPLFRGSTLMGGDISTIQIGTGTTNTERWFLDTNIIDAFAVNNRFTTYPYGVSGFSHYTNYNKDHFYDPNELKFSNTEDMYDIYYSDYIADLTSEESRILDCYVYLLPEEIKSIKFNERIFVDGNYYRINRIDNYDLTTSQPVYVQLVKLTRDYRGHRIAYFDLINCGEGADLHTNSDLTYTMYQWVGNYVKIGSTCYEVVLGEYNSGYTYTDISIGYSGSSYTPLVYTGCGCTTKIINNNIYNNTTPPPTPLPSSTPEVSPTRTPTLTPTKTKTPTPTPTPTGCNCVNYRATANEFEPLPVSYVDCNLVFQEITIPRGESQTFCACEGSVDASGGELEQIGSCTTPTPTPTKTPTLTPTPTTFECYTYSISNSDDESQGSYEAILCENGCESEPLIYVIEPSQSIEICACNNSVSAVSGLLVITKENGCVPPTATPTLTPTRTPSSTPAPPEPPEELG